MKQLKLAALAIVALFTFFVNNSLLVPDIMESRNLITAREMVEKQNWLIPTMNGNIRLEKPPLPTWVAAVVESAAPNDVGAQRAAAGCMALMLTLFFYLFARNRLKIDATLTTLVLLTSYNVVLMGRTVSWDIYTHAFMMGGIYFLSGALTGSGREIRNFVWAGIFMGLSIMSKGPVSVYALLLPYIIAVIVCVRPCMKGKWRGVAIMALLAVVIGCWWYGYIYIFESDALKQVAAQETGAWAHRNVRPWWYYHTFYLEAGIWAPMLITSIFLIIFRYSKQNKRSFLLPLIWLAVSLVLLSLLPEKKTRYLLPTLLPASLIVGQMLTIWKSGYVDKALMRINCWLLVIVALAVPVVAWIAVYSKGNMEIWQWIILTIFFIAIAIVLAGTAIKIKPARMVWTVAVMFIAIEAFGLPYIVGLINNSQMHGVANTINDSRLKNIPFYYNSADPEGLRIEIVYAARREILPLDTANVDGLIEKAPFVYLSHIGGTELPKAFLEKVDTTYIGRFDDNRRPKGTRRYSPLFIYHLTLVKPKP